jgi:hypothetical protein
MMNTKTWTRRRWQKAMLAVGLAYGTGAGWALSASARSKKNEFDPLIIHGGPSTPSLSLIHMAESGALLPAVKSARFKMFRGADEVRAGMVGNGWPISMVPSQLAANLYNRKMPIHYMTVLTWGLTYFVSRTSPLTSIEQLAGRRIALPSKNDLADQLFNHFVDKMGLKRGHDIHIAYMTSPVEAVQWLHAGQVDHVLLSEPQCSAAIMRSEKVKLHRGMPFGELRRYVDGHDGIPMAGIMVHRHVLDDHPEIVTALRKALQDSVRWVRDNSLAAAEASTPYFSIPAPIIAATVEHSNLVADDAIAHREQLNQYFEMITRFNSAMIGGKAPDDGFYI